MNHHVTLAQRMMMMADIGHVSRSSCDSEMGQESTDTEPGHADFLDSDDKKKQQCEYMFD